MEITCVVIFHRLEIQFCFRSDTCIISTGTVTQYSTSNVCAVTRMSIRSGAISNHIDVSDNSCAEVAMILIQSLYLALAISRVHTPSLWHSPGI